MKKLNILILIIFLGFSQYAYPVNNDKNDGYSAIFNGDAYLSEVLLFDMGSLVLKFTHPLSHHRDTVMKNRRKNENGDTIVTFETEYRSWTRGNTMTWSLIFNKFNILKNINFVNDTGTFKSGLFYNRVKNKIINGILSIFQKLKEGDRRYKSSY